MKWRPIILGCAVYSACAVANNQPQAQELEIRRWNQLPINQNFVTLNYGHTSGEIAFDPVLQIENASLEMDTWLAAYVRTASESLARENRIEKGQLAWPDPGTISVDDAVRKRG